MDEKLELLKKAFNKLGEVAELFEQAEFEQTAGVIYLTASKALLAIQEEGKKHKNNLDADVYDETLMKIFNMEI